MFSKDFFIGLLFGMTYYAFLDYLLLSQKSEKLIDELREEFRDELFDEVISEYSVSLREELIEELRETNIILKK